MLGIAFVGFALVSGLVSNGSAADGKEVVYYLSIDGQPDLELLQGSDPCISIKSYCLDFTPRQYDACFDMLHARVSMQLGHHWLFAYEKLKVNENLFIQCNKYKHNLVKQNNGTSYSETHMYEPETFEILMTDSSQSKSYDVVIQQLMDRIIMLLKNDSFTERDIALFDARTNELKLSTFQKLQMYRKALLKFPTNLFIVSQFGLALMRLGFEEDARLVFHNGVARGLWDNPLQRPEFKYKRGLTSKPWHDKHDFSFTAVLENGAKQIKNELYNLGNLQHQSLFLQDYENVPLCGNWKAINLITNDGQRTKYAEYFPKTMEIIDNSGQEFITIKFSAIQPGTHIAPHTGPSNQRLRVHLPLVHTGGAKIRVGTEWKSWEEEKIIILDSSWEHEVVHNGSETRIVLILDIWHPELPLKDRILHL